MLRCLSCLLCLTDRRSTAAEYIEKLKLESCPLEMYSVDVDDHEPLLIDRPRDY